jgi:hypothetical protein
MGRESIVFYKSFYDAIKGLNYETQSKIYNAIFAYQFDGIESELDGVEKAVFTLIKPQLDANNTKYENGCKGKEYGKLGGRPKKETPKKPLENPKQTPNDNENENVNDNENDIYTLSEAKASSSDTAKASKHKYGEFKHVLLKDEELQALKKDFANWEELIKYLDEYIEMKGYKAKSHYLCIKRWVVDAVKKNTKQELVKNTFHSEQYSNLDKFYL